MPEDPYAQIAKPADPYAGIAKAALPAPNPMGLANKELEKSGIQVGAPKLTLPEPKFTGGPIARAATAAGAVLAPTPYDPKRSMISQQLENMEAQNPTNAKRTIAGIAERAGGGDVAGALGEAGGIAAPIVIGSKLMKGGGSPGLDMQAPLTAKPVIPYGAMENGINRFGRTVEEHAPTIGKVAGVGAGALGAVEAAAHGSPTVGILSLAGIPRATKFGTVAARGTGRLIASLAHPSAPHAPVTGGEYASPAPPPIRDVLAANPGEQARLAAIGTRPTEPLVLPRENRGLMLPDRGATVVPQSPSLPPRQAVAAIANEAVKGAGGQPELPAPIERGKPIYQRKPTAAAAEPTLTPVESSALNGFHYDPAIQTMTVGMKTGSQYRYAEVSPEEFQKFSEAKSKGKAYQDIKNNHVQTAVNYGKGWNATKPAKSLHSSETVPDLIPSLEESIRMARAKRK